MAREARTGDAEATAQLCGFFYPKVLKYMRYRVDAASAEDLTGEVFVRVLRHISEQRGSFVAWLYRIAANVVVDRSRSKAVRKERALEEEQAGTARRDRVSSEDSDRRMDIEAAIVRLTEDQRELVTLKFIQGLSNSEVAEITGRSPEAIRGLQFRALSAMRDLLQETPGGRGDAN